ncbi:MAG TPA: carboxypeptidase regulatory-like domain-containing protein, partial [Gemmatimonadaceae bacterium]|nr:carboxypeptidase regulatory-like domain-containing protein [Gemmatimonadaceae bacterium]
MLGVFAGHAAYAQAAGDVRGKVVDQTGAAVENADVELQPGSLRATTLDDGKFAITNVPRGVYVLSARRIGYEPTDVNIAVGDSSATFTITLAPIAKQLDAIHIREKLEGIQYLGVVLDQFDVPVTDAEVVAMGINNQLKTDGRGRFTVPKLAKGTLAIRIRKVGYAAYLGSSRILAERADTIRMSRLAAALTPVEIKERSGFGTDEGVYQDLDKRTRWKGAMAATISREELAQEGRANLCDVLHRVGDASRFALLTPTACSRFQFRVLIDGGKLCEKRMLTDFIADQVEMVEYFPASQNRRIRMTSDYSGTLAARGCPPEVLVIWMRPQAPKPAAERVVAVDPDPAVDSTIQRMPPVEVQVALANPSHLQGQVVDSLNHPIRSAVVYTEDPLNATMTDKNGYFKFGALPSGPITLRAEHGGFVPIEFQLRLPPDSTVGIGLKLLPATTPVGTMQLDTTAAQGRIV